MMNVRGAKKQKVVGSSSSGSAPPRDEMVTTAAPPVHYYLFQKILKPLAATRFLNSKDLGRLLLMTSKDISESIKNNNNGDGVWKTLCLGHWGVQDANTLLENTKSFLSPEACFRSFALKKSTQFLGARELQYTPKDYMLIISVRELDKDEMNSSDDTQGKPMFCKTIPGEDITEFFEKGSVEIEFDRPVWETTLQTFRKDRFPPLFFGKWKVGTNPIWQGINPIWQGTVHIMRRTDGRVIELVRSKQQDWVSGDKKGQAKWHSTIHGSVHDCFHHLDTKYEQDLVNHYWPDSNFDRFEIELDQKYQLVTNNTPSSGDEPNEAGAEVGIYSFGLYTHFWDREGKEGPVPVPGAVEGKDITFAHFLEAMEAWQVQS